jgi:hypothetical protein
MDWAAVHGAGGSSDENDRARDSRAGRGRLPGIGRAGPARDIQAPAQAMELAHQVAWKSPDANAKATELLKEALVRLVQIYLDQGSAGLVVYDNNATPVSVRSEIDKILRNSPNKGSMKDALATDVNATRQRLESAARP